MLSTCWIRERLVEMSLWCQSGASPEEILDLLHSLVPNTKGHKGTE